MSGSASMMGAPFHQKRGLVNTRRKAQAEDPEEPTNLVRQIDALALDGLATAQQSTNGMGLSALDMDWIEPPGPQHLRDPARICHVGLVAHRRQRGIHLAHFHADNIETS